MKAQRSTSSVLTVDYGSGNAQRLANAIRAPGLNCREVRGNDAAARAIVTDPPDVLIVDLTAGFGKGFRLVGVLTSYARRHVLKVVGITGVEGQPASRIFSSYRALGIDRCVSKAWPIRRQAKAVGQMLRCHVSTG